MFLFRVLAESTLISGASDYVQVDCAMEKVFSLVHVVYCAEKVAQTPRMKIAAALRFPTIPTHRVQSGSLFLDQASFQEVRIELSFARQENAESSQFMLFSLTQSSANLELFDAEITVQSVGQVHVNATGLQWFCAKATVMNSSLVVNLAADVVQGLFGRVDVVSVVHSRLQLNLTGPRVAGVANQLLGGSVSVSESQLDMCLYTLCTNNLCVGQGGLLGFSAAANPTVTLSDCLWRVVSTGLGLLGAGDATGLWGKVSLLRSAWEFEGVRSPSETPSDAAKDVSFDVTVGLATPWTGVDGNHAKENFVLASVQLYGVPKDASGNSCALTGPYWNATSIAIAGAFSQVATLKAAFSIFSDQQLFVLVQIQGSYSATSNVNGSLFILDGKITLQRVKVDVTFSLQTSVFCIIARVTTYVKLSGSSITVSSQPNSKGSVFMLQNASNIVTFIGSNISADLSSTQAASAGVYNLTQATMFVQNVSIKTMTFAVGSNSSLVASFSMQAVIILSNMSVESSSQPIKPPQNGYGRNMFGVITSCITYTTIQVSKSSFTVSSAFADSYEMAGLMGAYLAQSQITLSDMSFKGTLDAGGSIMSGFFAAVYGSNFTMANDPKAGISAALSVMLTNASGYAAGFLGCVNDSFVEFNTTSIDTLEIRGNASGVGTIGSIYKGHTIKLYNISMRRVDINVSSGSVAGSCVGVFQSGRALDVWNYTVEVGLLQSQGVALGAALGQAFQSDQIELDGLNMTIQLSSAQSTVGTIGYVSGDDTTNTSTIISILHTNMTVELNYQDATGNVGGIIGYGEKLSGEVDNFSLTLNFQGTAFKQGAVFGQIQNSTVKVSNGNCTIAGGAPSGVIGYLGDNNQISITKLNFTKGQTYPCSGQTGSNNQVSATDGSCT